MHIDPRPAQRQTRSLPIGGPERESVSNVSRFAGATAREREDPDGERGDAFSGTLDRGCFSSRATRLVASTSFSVVDVCLSRYS